MNEKKDKKSKKPEYVSKNWKSSQGIRLLAMVLAIVSGFFVAVTGVITVTLGMTNDLQGSRKDIEKSLDTELLMAEIRNTRPLSVLMAEQVQSLRDWARERTVPAD